ncbi:hypothetical protein ACP70R_027404 [Stipagrostis hirtigluma subsp. patula]
MAEMEEALRTCMERLVMARDEREQIILEAANEISSEKKKARELQRKLEDAERKAAKLAAENSSLCKAVDAKDTLIRELRASAASAGDKLADATARLEAAQKRCGSLQYEVRMLQRELEVRGQEREYDLRSADAARRQQAEQLKRIAQLEAECQRLRAMVRKRLPGPAAIAKMRDEVDHQQQPQPQQAPGGASPRRSRSATPSTPRSVTPLAPRASSPTPRRSVSDHAESHVVKLRAVEEENGALRQALAKRESELQLVQMKYADEACRLTVVQKQLKKLTEENRQLSDANCQSESWASALISELEQFRSGNQGGARASIVAADMSLLDDFAEIEKMEMAPGDQMRNAKRTSPEKKDAGSVTPEKNGNDLVQDGSISNGHPERVQDIWELVEHKHKASGESVETILEEIRHALGQGAICAKRGASDASYDRPEIEKMVRNLVEEITPMIHKSAEDKVAKSGPLLSDKPELCGRLEHLVQVCNDLLDWKADLEKFVNEVCLILKYLVSKYLSNQERSDATETNTKDSDGDKSPSTVNTNVQPDIPSAKSVAALDTQIEAQAEAFQSVEGKITVTETQEKPFQSVEGQNMVNHQEKLDKVLTSATLEQDDNILPGRKSVYCEIESLAAEPSVEDWVIQEQNQLAINPDILAAADKLAECQETITILSKQLQALKTPTNPDPLSSPICNPRPSSADYKPQSLASIISHEFTKAECSRSPAASEQVPFKKEQCQPDATLRRSTARKLNSYATVPTETKESAQFAACPVSPVSRQDSGSDDPRKKKRGPSLMGRIMSRMKV